MLVGRLSPAGPLLSLHPSCVGQASVGIFAPHQREDSLRMIYLPSARTHEVSSVESAFEPETLRLRGRHRTTRPLSLNKIQELMWQRYDYLINH
ncbi:hypothetical protein AVEN_156640-1 [Araneus ventricosus]|uniref:Uncharacterized protein n=1 Tax=Araneus ventricosus TaxID=182803 RepID=A0A4Y2MKQ2_ARAVE|nr:hypothetical protein AVEN_156640-1 [Araneus ventricosus]